MICKYCGKEFNKKSNSQKYCSKQCSDAAKKLQDKHNNKVRYREEQKNKPVTTGVCECCNREFIRTHGNQKYCSTQCRNESNRFKNADAANKYYHHTKKLRGGDKVWGLGSGGLGPHKHEDLQVEFEKIKKEMDRLGLKNYTVKKISLSLFS